MFEYRRGYFKALLDMKNWIENHSFYIKYQKIKSLQICDIIQFFIENQDDFMQQADCYEIGIIPENKKLKQKFKVFKINKKENVK